MSLPQMSFAGAVMILAITVIRAVTINRLPKKTFLALWGITLVRLLIPFSMPSVFSVYSLFGRSSQQMTTAANNTAAALVPSVPTGQITATTEAVNKTTASISVWAAIWAVGVLACALFFALTYWKCLREFQTSLPVENDFTKGWLAEHSRKRTISLRQSDRISAPLTFGIVHPIILMPKATDWTDETALQYILAHEFVHIRRFDTVSKLALTAAVCVHWCNPLVWVMYVLANRDLELSCDESVIRLFGENTKSAYARTLIRMEERKSGLRPLCNNFSKNAIEERIVAIMKMKKTSLAAMLAAATLVVGVGTAFATSARAASNTSGENVESLIADEIILSTTDENGNVQYNTSAAYEKLIAYKTEDYGQQSIADFNATLASTPDEWTAFLAAQADVINVISPDDENYDFFTTTMFFSANELYCEYMGEEVAFSFGISRKDRPCDYLDDEGNPIYEFTCFVESNIPYSIDNPKLVTVAERDTALLTFKEEMQNYLNGLSEAEIAGDNIKEMLTDKSAEIANRLSTENMSLSPCEIYMIEINGEAEENR